MSTQENKPQEEQKIEAKQTTQGEAKATENTKEAEVKLSSEQRKAKGGEEMGDKRPDEMDDRDADYEDDEEEDADIGEELTEEQLKALGVNLEEINAETGDDMQDIDNRSWVTDNEIAEEADFEETEEDLRRETTSVQSFTDRIKRVYKDHTDAIITMEVINNNVFTGGMDDRLVKWDINSETPIASQKFTETVSFIAKREESDLLAAGFLDDKIVIFKASTFEVLQTIKTEYDEITSLSFHEKSDSILASFKNGSIHMWNAPTGKQMASFYGHFDEVTDAQFTVDSRYSLTP